MIVVVFLAVAAGFIVLGIILLFWELFFYQVKALI